MRPANERERGRGKKKDDPLESNSDGSRIAEGYDEAVHGRQGAAAPEDLAVPDLGDLPPERPTADDVDREALGPGEDDDVGDVDDLQAREDKGPDAVTPIAEAVGEDEAREDRFELRGTQDRDDRDVGAPFGGDEARAERIEAERLTGGGSDDIAVPRSGASTGARADGPDLEGPGAAAAPRADRAMNAIARMSRGNMSAGSEEMDDGVTAGNPGGARSQGIRGGARADGGRARVGGARASTQADGPRASTRADGTRASARPPARLGGPSAVSLDGARRGASTDDDVGGARDEASSDTPSLDAANASPSRDDDTDVPDDATILDEAGRIADRDQLFGADHRTRPGGELDTFEDSWSGDLEEQVKGDRSISKDAVDELAGLSGVERVPDGGEADDEPPATGPASLRGDDDEGEHARLNGDQLRQRAKETGLADREDELDELRRMLQERRQDLMRVIVASTNTVKELITPSENGESQVDYNHPSDMVEGDPDYEKHIQIAERQKAELAMVDSALHKLDVGEYGICEDCGDDIGIARLRAVPFTKRCIACAEKGEARERAAGARVPPARSTDRREDEATL